jgi:hypothetical protein
MYLDEVRRQRRILEEDTGYEVDSLVVRPEIQTSLCAETSNCPFGIIEFLDGMIVTTSDLIIEDFIFYIRIEKTNGDPVG